MPFFDDDEFFGDLLLMGAAGGGKSVEATATGNPLTFVTDLAKPLRSLLIPFTPVQSGTGDPSPSNIRPLVPWDGLTVEHFDKNLLAINRTSAQTTQGMTYTPIKQNNVPVAVKVEGTRTSNNPFFNLNYTTKPGGGGAGISIPPGTYKIFGGTPEVRLQVFYHDANGVERLAGYCDGNAVTVTIPDDCMSSWCRLLTWVDTPVDTVIYPIIMSADSSVTVYPVSFPSPVYGGTLDVVSGVLRIEWAGFTATWGDGGSATDMGSGITRKIFPMVDYLTTGSANNLCNIAPYSANESANTHFYYSGSGATNRNCRLFLPSDTPDTTEITVITKLSQAQEITLTPEQITALKGENTIWSDAGGSMTAVYLKKG